MRQARSGLATGTARQLLNGRGDGGSSLKWYCRVFLIFCSSGSACDQVLQNSGDHLSYHDFCGIVPTIIGGNTATGSQRHGG
jgi:hypothetical protein